MKLSKEKEQELKAFEAELENQNWKTGVDLEESAKALLIGVICFLITIGLILGGAWIWRCLL